MSFGGFSSGAGDARMVENNLYSSTINPSLQPIFNSFASKPKMEGVGSGAGGGGDMGRGDHFVFGAGVNEENESSDNNEGASGDDPEASAGGSSSSARRKKYHRHTPLQIQELEALFKENPHPDEKARLELGRRLNLESKQVKFWFQNRRTQMKTQMERHENSILKNDNDRLRIENAAMKEAMRNPMCSHCGSPGALGDVSIEEHHLRIENARLKDELNRACLLANRFLGRPMTQTMPLGGSDLDLAVGRSGLGLGGVSSMQMGLDFGSGGMASPLPVMPRSSTGMGMGMGLGSLEFSVDKQWYLDLAMTAMDELMKLGQVDAPLWLKGSDGSSEVLNLEEYARSFPPCIGMKPSTFLSEATRASGTVIINGASLVEVLLDAHRLTEMFGCLLGETSITEVISSGVGGTRNGTLYLMHTEFQVLSPLVGVRQVKFLRFCKQQAEGCWAVVDISVDSAQDGTLGHSYSDCRRLPSGCILQDLPNGYSKVIWIEHMEYDGITVHESFRPLLRSGLGIGARKWIATLERQCEFLAVMMSSTVPGGDQAVISPTGRKSLAKLAQRMTRNFCAGVCSTLYKWDILQMGSAEDPKLMMRKGAGNPGEPPGMVLSATLTIWLPVSQDRIFDYLQNERTRDQWDILSENGPIQQMLHIAKGQDIGNSISLLRPNVSNPSTMLILQEACTDATGSLLVYAAVDVPAMNVVMSGGDSSVVVLLPSGFTILPDCQAESTNPNSSAGGTSEAGATGGGRSSGGSFLTVGFQILVNNLPTSKLTMESVDTVNSLVSRTIQGVKSAFQCN